MVFGNNRIQLDNNNPLQLKFISQSQLFTTDQVKVFEYAKDMSEWYMSGSASSLNAHLACELVQDMFDKLLEAHRGPIVSAYFAHSTTFQLFLTALGIAVQDTPLRADNYKDMTDRQWKTSQISPFATNLAVVRHNCTDGVKVQFLFNERPLLLDWCTRDGLCDLGVIKERFSTIIAADCKIYYCPSKEYFVSLYVNG